MKKKAVKSGTMSEVERANAPKWKGDDGMFEEWYVTLNNVRSGSGFWISYHINAPEEGRGAYHGEVWFAHFNYREPDRNFAVKKLFAIDEVRGNPSPFHVRIGDCEFGSERIIGGLAGMGHEAFWDLHLSPSAEVHRHLPGLMYVGGMSETEVLSPNLTARFNGSIIADGVKYELKSDPGCQSHMWGTRHAHRWAWAHCSSFAEDHTAMFEGISAQVKIAGVPIPPLNFISIRHKDRLYNFKEFPRAFTVRGKFEPGLWHFIASGGNTMFRGEISCRFQDLVCAEYTDPDGERAYCNNTETGSAIIRVFKRDTPLSTWKHMETLTSLATTHMEFGARRPDPRVRKTFEELR